MSLDTVGAFVDSLGHVRLLEPEQQSTLARDLLPHFSDPRALAGELIRRGWLTPYQANLLLQQRGSELLLGSYVLLERIGEGGMGQVFKAKNWKLGRLVALKLIRKERLASEDAVRRFHREIRAAAQLSHANIVLAYDADEVNGTHFFAMEYVEGSDLAKLIKQHGPLPIAQACDWIRQAALGLQHAHERGLVHRDIKPHNLLLTKQGVIKVLDMGLARLMVEEGEDSTTMTQEGMVMGTPDYMAPEQAEESHTVDIRADLYSLGCTLYRLLTGKVPFPGGTLIQKLRKHQSEQPSPIEKARPDVPSAVADIVYRLMAKRPEDRYQTPAELVRALETLSTGLRTEARAIALEPAVNDVLDFRPSDETVQGMQDEQRSRRRTEKRKLLLAASAGGVLLLGLAAVLWLFNRRADHPLPPTQPVAVAQRGAGREEKRSFEQWLREVAALPAEKQVEAVAAELKKRNPGFDGRVTHKIEGGTVAVLEVQSNQVADVSPVRALSGLKSFTIVGIPPGRAPFTDLNQLKGMQLGTLGFAYTSVRDLTPLREMPLASLSCGGSEITDLSPLQGMRLAELAFPHTSVSELAPLQGMPLVNLYCSRTGVTDLTPLLGMRLNRLYCNDTRVVDLSPLKNMPLTRLNCDNTRVADLSVVKGMPLTLLECSRTPVSDLSVLKGMSLTGLLCDRSAVTDLSPLAGMPLREISCNFVPERDASILRSIKTLVKINGKPAAEFWKELDARRAAFEQWKASVQKLSADEHAKAVVAELKRRNPTFDGSVTHKAENGVVVELRFASGDVTDLTPVRALTGLKRLVCASPSPHGLLTDLSPLWGMRLTFLNVNNQIGLADLSPLRGMPLTILYCADTRVADLTPLKESPLVNLNCQRSEVSDLSPLKGTPLATLWCFSTKITDLSPLKDLPLQTLQCDFKLARESSFLRSIRTLETINGKPAAEFWKNASDSPKP